MRIAFLILLLAPLQTPMANELSPYSNACESLFKAEAKFIEDGLTAAREKWRTKVRLAFDAKALTDSQRASAEQAFAALVAKMANDFGKTLSLPSIFRTLSMAPVLTLDTCNEPAKLHALGEQSIAGFEDILEKLLPMIDTVSEAAKR